MPALFIPIEGADNTGKTTMCRFLAAYCSAHGLPAIAVQDPGTTEVGLHMRTYLKDPKRKPLNPRAEILLFNALKTQMVAEVVEPKLREEIIVFSDRYALSTFVYQGVVRGLYMPDFMELMKATAAPDPHGYLVLQAPYAVLRERMGPVEEHDLYENEHNLNLMVAGFVQPSMWTSRPFREVDTSDSDVRLAFMDALKMLKDMCPADLKDLPVPEKLEDLDSYVPL